MPGPSVVFPHRDSLPQMESAGEGIAKTANPLSFVKQREV